MQSRLDLAGCRVDPFAAAFDNGGRRPEQGFQRQRGPPWGLIALHGKNDALVEVAGLGVACGLECRDRRAEHGRSSQAAACRARSKTMAAKSESSSRIDSIRIGLLIPAVVIAEGAKRNESGLIRALEHQGGELEQRFAVRIEAAHALPSGPFR